MAEQKKGTTMAEQKTGTIKTSWPELNGKTYDEAEKTIKRDRPDVTVPPAIPEGSPVTMDYREDRVRVFVNTENIVVGEPRIG